MNDMTRPTVEQELASPRIRENLEFLDDYASDDWLGFSGVTGMVVAARRSGKPDDLFRDIVLAVVRELLARGVRAGDLTGTGQPVVVPWPGAVDEVMSRIEREITALGRLPDSGEVCWFTRPDSSDTGGPTMDVEIPDGN
jgi:hypothetical protein